jgi:hypothetical protein
MKRPSKFGGETGALAGVSTSPLGPPQSEAIIQFPSPAAKLAGAREDAGVPPASASSSFVSLGSAISPVILLLQGGFPRVKVLADAPREEVRARRPFSQPVEEGEPD